MVSFISVGSIHHVDVEVVKCEFVNKYQSSQILGEFL